MQTLEHVIFNKLCSNSKFRQKVLPYLKQEYFDSYEHKAILRIIDSYVQKYKTNVIDFNVLSVEAENEQLNEGQYNKIKQEIDSIKRVTDDTDIEWLTDQTEKFCQIKAVANALYKSVDLFEKAKKQGNSTLGAIPSILQDALKVTFDTSLGHDYFGDAEAAFDVYNNPEGTHIPFNLEYFDKVTNGGILRKTLNIVMAGTGGGKSMFMCSQAANYLLQGLNVLYLTGEMSEHKIRERIDANLLDIDINMLRHMSKSIFMAKVNKLQLQTTGKLKIKEFSEGGTTNALHFDNWVEDMKTKENFVPDVIIIDYLTLVGSHRISASHGMYSVGKSVSEEIRAFARKHNCAILTGAQFNRGGMNNSDPGLSNTSESVGIPFTADFIFALVGSEQLDKVKQRCVKQLKNRYNDEGYFNKFIIGIDKPKMRFFDVEESAQLTVDDIEDEPVGNNKLKKAAWSNQSDFF